MNLGGKAVLEVPRGYSYHEGPLPLVRGVPAVPQSIKETQLGSVQRGLMIVGFSYVADPQPAATHWLMRAQAFLNLNVAANLAAKAANGAGGAGQSTLTSPRFRGTGSTPKRLFSIKIIANDRFDPSTASLYYAIGVGSPVNRSSELLFRKRTTLFYSRHGLLVAESTEFGKPRSVNRDYEDLTQNLSFAQDEAPILWDRIPLMISSNIRQLPPYAFGGLFAGMTLALFRNRRSLWHGSEAPPPADTSL